MSKDGLEACGQLDSGVAGYDRLELVRAGSSFDGGLQDDLRVEDVEEARAMSTGVSGAGAES